MQGGHSGLYHGVIRSHHVRQRIERAWVSRGSQGIMRGRRASQGGCGRLSSHRGLPGQPRNHTIHAAHLTPRDVCARTRTPTPTATASRTAGTRTTTMTASWMRSVAPRRAGTAPRGSRFPTSRSGNIHRPRPWRFEHSRWV